MDRRWRAGLVVCFVLGSMWPAPAARAANAVRPPVMNVDFPDPSIVRSGGTYYLFSTNSSSGNVPVARSSDLNSWQVVGDALPHLGSWASSGFTWAPEVIHTGTSWTLYYTANDTSSGRQCIGRAVASTPTGPFTDGSDAPLVCQLARGGSIDPSVFVAPDATRWLVWKSDDNAIGNPSHLWSQQLSPDARTLIGPLHDLLAEDQAWESPTIEGPIMTRVNGQTYLFYGAGWWESTSAAIGYATCADVTGPCTKVTTSSPWMSTDNAGVTGPHGPSFVTSANGTSVLAFAAWVNAVGYANGGSRAPHIEPVDFSVTPPTWRPDRPRGGPIEPHLPPADARGLAPVLGHWNRFNNGIDHSAVVGVPSLDYGFESTLGDLLAVQETGTVPIYSCRTGSDEFTSTASNCEGRELTSRLGFIYSSPPPGLPVRQIWRCHAGDHFDSQAPNCEGATVEGPLGYVLAVRPWSRFNNGSDHSAATGLPSTVNAFEGSYGELLSIDTTGAQPIYSCRSGPDEFTSLAANCEGRSINGLLGYIYSLPPPSSPSQQIWRCRGTDHFDSTDPGCEGTTVEGSLGFVVATVPWNRFNNGSDHATVVGLPASGYRLDGTLGHLLTVPATGTVALYSCQIGSDEFTSTASNCEGQHRNGLLGYAYSTAPAGVTSQRAWRCRGTDHFDSTASNCEGATVEGPLGYLTAKT